MPTEVAASGRIELLFIGTRGNTEKRSRRHWRHSALLVRHAGTGVLIDCGADWLGHVPIPAPDAILLTHGHPDHAEGLAKGAPCPVFATAETWALLDAYPVADRRIVRVNRPFRRDGLTVTAFAVAHSVRAPAVGYRVSCGGTSFFYVPDVVAIRNRRRALRGVTLYIGDGATISRPMVRRTPAALIGHTPICTQLGWCEKERVRHAIFTHCGTQIVAGNARHLDRRVRGLGQARGVAAQIAYDGLRLVLPFPKGVRDIGRSASTAHPSSVPRHGAGMSESGADRSR